MTSNFKNPGGKAVTIPQPRRRAKSLLEKDPNIKLLLYGPPGSGKTYLAAQLVESRYKILILDTDVGGEGTNTITGYLMQKKKFQELAHNVITLSLEGYKEVMLFIENPYQFFEVYTGKKWEEFAPDFIMWDGFGNWQQIDVFDHALEFSGGEKATEQREAGLQAGTQDWGVILKATTKAFDAFNKITHPDGAPIFKIATMHEDDRQHDPTGAPIKPGDQTQAARLKTGHKPLLSGRAAKVIPGGADYVIRTWTKPGQDTTKTVFGWDLSDAGGFNAGKCRGPMLSGGPVITFDTKVQPIDKWREMCHNLNIPVKNG